MTTNNPAPKTWVALEAATAALLNAHLRDRVNFAQDPPYVEAQKLDAVVPAANSAWVPVPFSTALRNLDAMWNLANPTRLVAPIDGYYRATGMVEFVASANGTRGISFLRSDGTRFYGTVAWNAGAGAPTRINSTRVIPLTAGQWVELCGFQGSGGALNMTQGPELGAVLAFERPLGA